jgi:hypothetical protein
VDSSAITVINALMAEVEANKADPVALQAIVDRVKASNTKLGAAVSAGTPAAPSA